MGRSRTRPGLLLTTTLCLALALGPAASADTPADAIRAAVNKAAAAKSVRVNLTQTVTAKGKLLHSTANGVLQAGDQDLTLSGEGGESRRVAVGTAVYERRPNAANTPWRQSTRTAPTQTSALGGLTFADGTSLGDPKLYTTVTDAGTDTLPQGQARKLIAELDMGAVATAMRAGAADRARLSAMQATMTLWVSPADGSPVKHTIRLTIPGASGPTTIETSTDLADLDAPLVIATP